MHLCLTILLFLCSPLVRPHDDPDLIKAGKAIASLGIPPQDLHVWYSPYLRTQQTMDLVLKGKTQTLGEFALQLKASPVRLTSVFKLLMATIQRAISYKSAKAFSCESK